MDPRVAWIQPEQKGPANALWMQVWETSQGARTLSAQQQLHNQCVNYAALDVLKNVATAVAAGRSVCSGGGGVTASRSSGHRSGIMSGTMSGTAISALGVAGAALSNRNAHIAAEPADGKALPLGSVSSSSSSSSSSSQESGTDSPPSGCSLERTMGGNVTGNVNKNVGGANLLFSLSDSMYNNVNHHHQHHHHHHHHPHRHIQEQPAFNPQPVCVKRHQVHPSAPGNHTHNHHHPGRRKSDNKASTYGMNYLLSNCTNGNYASNWTPWKTRTYNPGVLGWVAQLFPELTLLTATGFFFLMGIAQINCVWVECYGAYDIMCWFVRVTQLKGRRQTGSAVIFEVWKWAVTNRIWTECWEAPGENTLFQKWFIIPAAQSDFTVVCVSVGDLFRRFPPDMLLLDEA